MKRHIRRAREDRGAQRRLVLKALSAGVALGLLGAACSSSSHSGNTATGGGGDNSTSSTAGGGSSTANKDAITLGILTPLTGSAAANYKGSVEGAQARLDAQNAAGGVDGHPLKLVTADDQSSPSTNLTGAQTLVSKGVFGIIGSSAFTFGSARYLHQQGIPVTGGGYDGPEWGQQPNTNMFAYSATYEDPHLPQYDQPAKFMKQLGVTRVASVGYAISPSATAAAKGFIFSAKAAGLAEGYLNTSLPFGTVNAGPLALAIKSSKSDGIYMPIDDVTAFAILTAAKQAGYSFKVAISATGYSQDLLDQPATVQAAQGIYFSSATAPVEISTPATKAMQAAFARYEHFTGVPNLNWYQGWIAADMFIKGLRMDGASTSRSKWMSTMRTVSSYDADGLLGSPVNFTKFGEAPPVSCSWYMKLTGNTFVPVPADGKPVCGHLIPNSNQA